MFYFLCQFQTYVAVYSSKAPHCRREIGFGTFLTFIWWVRSIVMPQKHWMGFPHCAGPQKEEMNRFSCIFNWNNSQISIWSTAFGYFLRWKQAFYDKPVSLLCPSWWTYWFCGRTFLKVLGFSRYTVFSISSVHLHHKQSISFWNISRTNLPNN